MTATQTTLALYAPEPVSARRGQRRAERARTIELHQHGKHAEVIAVAQTVAIDLCRTGKRAAPSWLVPVGCVTATCLEEEMTERGLLKPEDAADTRWKGGVFTRANGWRRVGYAPVGSKGRVVAVWERA